MFEFYLVCLKKSFKQPFTWGEKAGFIVGIVIPLLKPFIPKTMGTAMDSLIWQIPLVIFASLGIIRLLIAPYLVYKDLLQQKAELEINLKNKNEETLQLKKRQFAIPEELLAPTLRGLSFRITDLARDENIIRNKVFEDCNIFGPAVISLVFQNSLSYCNFQGSSPDSIFIEIQQNQATGAILFFNCIFRRCRFSKIGFIGKKNEIKLLKEGFNLPNK